MYRVQLDKFEGPLDLLLFFIKRDELDIYDIPIASITDEFLEYVRVLKVIDLDRVGDFIYMAAMLINIKAKLLLPSPEIDEEGEVIDPRQELVERLLEYIRYKDAAQQLSTLHDERDELVVRGAASAPTVEKYASIELVKDGSVFDLVKALRRVLTTAVEEPSHEVEAEAYSIEQQRQFLFQHLSETTPMSFVSLLSNRSKTFIITTFLALLEMARYDEIEISFSDSVDDFSLRKTGRVSESLDHVQDAIVGHSPSVSDSKVEITIDDRPSTPSSLGTGIDEQKVPLE